MKTSLLLVLFILGSFIANAQETKKQPPVKPAASKPAPALKPTTVKSTPAPTPAKSEQAKPVSPEEIQAAWQEYMATGANHELMARASGKWKETITLWSAPGAEPTINEANCFIQMIYEGRYQESVHNGTFNGMPFEGRGFMAYDNAAGKFYSTWIDNMSTGIMQTSGSFDSKNLRLELRGEVVDPVTKKISKIREVIYFKADNEQLHETYTTPAGGKEYKSMEIRMVR